MLTTESGRVESDIELSSDGSRCLDEIDGVLSPGNGHASNFIYPNAMWNGTLSPSMTSCLSSYATNHQEDFRQHQQHPQNHHHQQQERQIGILKSTISEPASPTNILLPDEQHSKTLSVMYRQPILISVTHASGCVDSGPTHYKCAQCDETFDSLLMTQEHVNNGVCNGESTCNVRIGLNFFSFSYSDGYSLVFIHFFRFFLDA